MNWKINLSPFSFRDSRKHVGFVRTTTLNPSHARFIMKGIVKTVSSLICVVGLIAIVSTNVGAAEIPIPTATKKITPPELGPVQPFNAKPGGLPSPQQTDLAVTSFGLTADARMTYVVVNRGRTAANSPFVVDLLIDGKREDTVKHNALPPLSQQRVISNLARPEVCSAVQLRIALDTQQLVNEADEANNIQSRQMVPPCPDLVVDIDKDSVSNGLKYRAKVQVTNKGNLTTQRQFYVLLKGAGSGLAFAALPILKRERMGPLMPGQTVSFYESGDHLGASTFHYGVLADHLEEIRESDESNNYKGETMGGGN